MGFLMEANSNRGIGCNKDQSIHSLQNKIHTPWTSSASIQVEQARAPRGGSAADYIDNEPTVRGVSWHEPLKRSSLKNSNT